MPVADVLYPVNLVVEGRRCVVVGGGAVAARKVEGLMAAGADVVVIAPQIDDQIRSLGVAVGRAPVPPRRPGGRLAGHRRHRRCRRSTGPIRADARRGPGVGQRRRRPGGVLVHPARPWCGRVR